MSQTPERTSGALIGKLLAISTMTKTPYLWLRLYAPEQAFWNKTFKVPDMEFVNQTRRVWYPGRYYASGYACSTLSGGLIIKDIDDRLPDLCMPGRVVRFVHRDAGSDHFSPKRPVLLLNLLRFLTGFCLVSEVQ
jgi:hypothetical protein